MNGKYSCPMHPDVKSSKPGQCPKCGMALTLVGESHSQHHKTNYSFGDYSPLLVVISLITLASLAISIASSPNIKSFISYFMVGFFLAFSGFKLMDIRGFAEGYSTYDLLAKRWFGWGYIYPFVELFFALAMIINLAPRAVLITEVVVMTFSGLGVVIKLLKREKFQCACLGTFLKVPLTKITAVEDFGMAALALILLLTL